MGQMTVEAVKKREVGVLELLLLGHGDTFPGSISGHARLLTAAMFGIVFFALSFVAREVPGSLGATYPLIAMVGCTVVGALFGYFFLELVRRFISLGVIPMLLLFALFRSVAAAFLPFRGGSLVATAVATAGVWFLIPPISRVLRRLFGVSTTYRSV